MAMPKLNDKELESWNKGEWTPEGVQQVEVKTLADALGVSIGRAATIKAQCATVEGGGNSSQLEKALAGDKTAQRAISSKTHGHAWVALRGGKPDLEKTKELIDEQAARPAHRTMFKGLFVCNIDELAKAADKLPRCPLTHAVLDDHEGKLFDGNTGADWAPVWPDRGNGRALMLIHAKNKDPRVIPPYASTDPARVAAELAQAELPPQWQRAANLWGRASTIDKALAEESLFSIPEAVGVEPSGEIEQAPVAAVEADVGANGKPVVFILAHPKDKKYAEDIRTYCAPLANFPAVIRLSSEVGVGASVKLWSQQQLSVAAIVIAVVSGDFLADDELPKMFINAMNAKKVSLPFIARACLWEESFFGHIAPLGGTRGDALEAARSLRVILGRMTAPLFAASDAVPTAAKMREQLFTRLKTDSDFNAFCLDHFPKTYAMMGSGMDRMSKTTMLLTYVGLDQIWAHLKHR